MEYIIVAILAFIAGWTISSWISAHAFREILNDLGVSDDQLMKFLEENPEAEEEVELEVMEIKIEEHEGRLYAYRLDDDQFLGQGTDHNTLINRLTENLTNVKLIISEENGAKLIAKES
jgi:hypothetical protein